MTVIRRRKDYVSERVYYHDAAVETVEDDPLSLFRSLQIAPDGSIVQEAIGSRLHQIDAALHNETLWTDVRPKRTYMEQIK